MLLTFTNRAVFVLNGNESADPRDFIPQYSMYYKSFIDYTISDTEQKIIFLSCEIPELSFSVFIGFVTMHLLTIQSENRYLGINNLTLLSASNEISEHYHTRF